MSRRDPGNTQNSGDAALLFSLARRFYELPDEDKAATARALERLAEPEVWTDERWTAQDSVLRMCLRSVAKID